MTYDQIFLEVISIIIVLNAVIAPICKLWKGYPSWTYVIISWLPIIAVVGFFGFCLFLLGGMH